MIIYKKGNLLDAFDCGEVNLIAHGCNCFCTMRAGIAYQIKNRYPKVYEADIMHDKKFNNRIDKLGSICIINFGDKVIANLYTQYHYSKNKLCLSYEALDQCFKSLYFMYGNDKVIGIPKIGCGLAGGDWNKVSSIIENIFSDKSIFVYTL